ncbi:MAG: glycosyltransferase [Proteobacteria bacterium]|nr:glycosyltransferase [Pseudomonadota bacterium]
MLTALSWCLLACTVVAATIYCAGVWATWRHFGRPRRFAQARLPPITLLKPIKGIEDELADNLRSFFEQDYPPGFEIVFSSTDPADPGIAIARAIAEGYPEVACKFVVSDRHTGANPKVANLQGALRTARHDLVVQSDANVRIEPGMLRKLVSEYLTRRASLLTGVVVGVGERSVGAALENLQLSAFTGPATCLASAAAGITCVIGKCLAFRRSELDSLGGLAVVGDVLAEDYVLGELYRKNGKNVVLSRVRANNVNADTSVARFLERHARWLKMRAVVSAPGYVADLMANPTVFALAAWVSAGAPYALAGWVAWLGLTKALCDGWLVRLTRGAPMRVGYLWLAPVRDLLLAFLWLYCLFSRRICWRGSHFRLGPGSVLLPVVPAGACRSVNLPQRTRERAVCPASPAPSHPAE